MDLSIAEGKLMLNVQGADKLWAFKSSLEIPLVHITGVRADPKVARGWWRGMRMPGTSVPGVITAGTFYQDGKRVFWDDALAKAPSIMPAEFAWDAKPPTVPDENGKYPVPQPGKYIAYPGQKE